MNQLLLGAISMASLVAAVFFLRFWRNTGDRFFLFFAAAFGLEGVNRALLGLDLGSSEHQPIYYSIRLLSYILILIAIVDKNRARPSHDQRNDENV